ncbi:hypothetical protein RRG08_029892 [Elysia crispata]|uniref:Uncharacterized protein n=1 Tax=Elysia crispata TaxID=231223 RepID=A0AAE0YJQ6_9GAST|nr:hypothetical protein RRG08_029892 [Elysia crispata]
MPDRAERSNYSPSNRMWAGAIWREKCGGRGNGGTASHLSRYHASSLAWSGLWCFSARERILRSGLMSRPRGKSVPGLPECLQNGRNSRYLSKLQKANVQQIFHAEKSLRKAHEGDIFCQQVRPVSSSSWITKFTNGQVSPGSFQFTLQTIQFLTAWDTGHQSI